MDEQQNKSLSERIERLEAVVEELQRALKLLIQAAAQKDLEISVKARETLAPKEAPAEVLFQAPPPAPAKPSPRPPEPGPPARKAPAVSEAPWQKSEFWLNKIGIGLLLFGVVFLFKYSIDQGWLTPPVRVLFGLALGIGLFATGIRLHAKRRHFSLVLLGGAIATFYITGFAAFQLYSLVPYSAAFAFMAAVTVLAFSISLRQNEAVLSLIGAIGGLATPFLLYTPKGSLPGLVGYTCLILAGTSIIYLFRGWRSLLWVSVIGGWAVLIVGYGKGIPSGPGKAALRDLWALQSGILFMWLAFWALPVVREVLEVRSPGRWVPPSLDFLKVPVDKEAGLLMCRSTAHVLAVSTPLAALWFSRALWPLSSTAWGWISMGGMFVYGLSFWSLRRWDGLKNLAYTHGLMALALLTIALCLLLKGNVLFLTLAAEATILHLVSHRLSDRGTAIAAHILFGVLAIWLIFHQSWLYQQTSMKAEETTIFNARVLIDFAVIAAAFGVSRVLRSPLAVRLYRFAALIFLTVEFCVLLTGNVLFFTLVVEAAVLHLIACRLTDRDTALAANILSGIIGILLVRRLTGGFTFVFEPEGRAVLNWQAATDLAAIAIGVGVSTLFRSKAALRWYRLVAHLAVLGWFLREFYVLQNGQAYITTAWGIYGVILLVLGLRRNLGDLRTAAMGTLFLVVGKLFLVDLRMLEAIWRILLFLCFGGLFLVLSYYFRVLWKASPEPGSNK
ncbi:MAG TPA: DUF2339 domain-containing protein [archaeon]|nr:DUF2339 domain-containing protein [archaeon]